MDPISIIGGISAILQLTSLVAKRAKEVYDAADIAGSLAEDVKFFGSNIDFFGIVMTDAHSTIRGHYSRNKDSPAILKIHRGATLETLASQTRHLMLRVKGLRTQARSDHDGLSIWDRWRWIRKKKQRTEILLMMQRVQANFQIVIQLITYEALVEREANPLPGDELLYKFKKEGKKQRRTIQALSRTVLVLRNRYERLHLRQRELESEHLAKQFNIVEDVLIDFNNAIVSNPPSMPSTSSLVFDPTPLSSQSSRNRTDAEVYAARLDRDPNGIPLRATHQRRSSLYLNQDTTMGVAVEQPFELSGEPEMLGEMSHLSTTSPSMSPLANGGPVQEPNTMEWEERDYMSIQPSRNILLLDPADNFQIETGRVSTTKEFNTSREDVSDVNAWINYEFTTNVISELCAAKLGLEVEWTPAAGKGAARSYDHLDDLEERAIDFGNGNVQPVTGLARFWWGVVGRRPLKITCLVCRSLPFSTPLVLGQEYLDKKKYYEGKRR